MHTAERLATSMMGVSRSFNLLMSNFINSSNLEANNGIKLLGFYAFKLLQRMFYVCLSMENLYCTNVFPSVYTALPWSLLFILKFCCTTINDNFFHYCICHKCHIKPFIMHDYSSIGTVISSLGSIPRKGVEWRFFTFKPSKTRGKRRDAHTYVPRSFDNLYKMFTIIVPRILGSVRHRGCFLFLKFW